MLHNADNSNKAVNSKSCAILYIEYVYISYTLPRLHHDRVHDFSSSHPYGGKGLAGGCWPIALHQTQPVTAPTDNYSPLIAIRQGGDFYKLGDK